MQLNAPGSTFAVSRRCDTAYISRPVFICYKFCLSEPSLHKRNAQTLASGVLEPSIPILNKNKPLQTNNVAIFVEPSPFSHVSGMKNRFECLIKGLREAGDQVTVVTPDPEPPAEFCGAKVVNVLGFKLPFYSSPTLLLSLGLSVRVLYHLVTSRPQIIHVSSPGLLVFAATMYAKLLRIPLVVSYHTHIPEYIPKYTWKELVHPMWSIIRWCTRASDLTLVTSAAMKSELIKNLCRVKSIDVWQRGVDTEVFNPKFRDLEMRQRMTGGNLDSPLLVYVGRLGNEKNLAPIKTIMENLPKGTRMAFVGDGPQRAELEEHFNGMPVVFMGMLKGDELSKAYASADIFVMPSETETLGFVVLEAMASGLAVVAVAAGGLTDIITQKGKVGHLYPSGDYAEAARLIRQLIEDPSACKAMSAAGRAEVEKFGWSAATKVLREQQYSRAIKVNSSKQRFRFMAVRIGIGRLLKMALGAFYAFFLWILEKLDYARSMRPHAA
ncbi:hypothetical protein CEUSTIGMA_g9548.t1 [Chlamydomonas eustigma]|uniref:Glycosyltransferase subfamily 4-like N-terminal domain-containing protein n=1 Tax=Chlamydomonas eustigma TaxID=1157962 RepID=A0A250XH52_9CHLO|nr:hypothetical protein CEUSTIGMA_g9548.t1 [Chlamydomonas eustigma]|eukprot:GAX82120.1 hypothetical protein CEUSTIGMA_g9548.t1 [Chlamydomonas eustigma]